MYADVLAEHRRILRAAFAKRGGIEVDTQGDAFFYAFARAGDAVEAASEGQDGLAGGPVSVRIGVHTGEPLVAAEGMWEWTSTGLRGSRRPPMGGKS